MFITKLVKLFCSQSRMHPYLFEGLTKHNALPLRPLQIKTFDIFDQGHNLIINEMDGSGKTLGYLIPIINHILLKKERKQSPSTTIILTLNKQLVLQIYQQIRKLDSKNKLSVIRSGSITHYSAIIQQMCKPKQLQDQDLINQLIDKNVADSVLWSKTDILISTPHTFYRIMARKIQDKEKIDSQFLVIDEANDIIARSSQLRNYIQKIIEYLQKIMLKQRKLRYIISSLYLRDDNKFINSLGTFSNLPQYQPFNNTDYCTPTSIIQHLSISFIKIHELSKNQILEQKMENLLKCLEKRMSKKLIIYCLSSNVEKIKKMLKIKLNIETLQYYAGLSSEKRISVLEEFNQEKNQIMIATELAAKGLNFRASIDAIISFDMNTDIWEEVSRICRSNKVGAQYIMMSTEDDSETLVNLISAKLEGEASKYLQNITIKELKFVNGAQIRV